MTGGMYEFSRRHHWSSCRYLASCAFQDAERHYAVHIRMLLLQEAASQMLYRFVSDRTAPCSVRSFRTNGLLALLLCGVAPGTAIIELSYQNSVSVHRNPALSCLNCGLSV